MSQRKDKRRKPTASEIQVWTRVTINQLRHSAYWTEFFDKKRALNRAMHNENVPIDAIELAEEDLKESQN